MKYLTPDELEINQYFLIHSLSKINGRSPLEGHVLQLKGSKLPFIRVYDWDLGNYYVLNTTDYNLLKLGEQDSDYIRGALKYNMQCYTPVEINENDYKPTN